MKTHKKFRLWAVRLLIVGLAIILICFCALESIILSGSRSSNQQEADVVIVLGAMVWKNGPSPVLVKRLNTAATYLKEHPDVTVMVSGGQGTDEPESEAQAMADYLIEQNIDPSRIILEDQSFNTYQNLSNCKKKLVECGYHLATTRLLVVSNGFHLTRVRMLAKRCGLQVATLAAPLPKDWKNKLYCYIREPLALVKSFLLDRSSPSGAAIMGNYFIFRNQEECPCSINSNNWSSTTASSRLS